MKYRKLSILWLKVFCFLLLLAGATFGTAVLLYKTLGVTYGMAMHALPVKKSELREELKHSSWCFYVPKGAADGLGEFMECGIRENGQEFLVNPLLDASENTYLKKTVREYFIYYGMPQPPGNIKLYWTGRNLYYGYYPGVSIVRTAIIAIWLTAPLAGVAAILMLPAYPALMLTAIIISIVKDLFRRKSKLQ